MSAISREGFRLLRDYVRDECGIEIGEERHYLIETRLRDLLRDEGFENALALLARVREERGNRLRDRIVEALTTQETSWFRDEAPFRVFEEVLLPHFEREAREGRRERLRVWSAACSTGQEPYSLAMSFAERARESEALDGIELEVLATDVSETALRQAREGLYGDFALERGLPDAMRRRYFRREGRRWRLDPAIRDRVQFRSLNLLDPIDPAQKFDVVFARYVALYFAPAVKHALFARLNQALVSGGHLFLGSSETLGESAQGFRQLDHGRALYYRSMTQSPRPAPVGEKA